MNAISPAYDSLEHIRQTIAPSTPTRDGLARLARLVRERRAADMRDEKLTSWVLFGRYLLCRSGRFAIYNQGAPAEGYPYWPVHREDKEVVQVPIVFPLSDITKYSFFRTSYAVWIPRDDQRCECCGRGWSVDNLHTLHWPSRDNPPRHKACHKLAVAEEGRATLLDTLKQSEIPFEKVTWIPNQYHHEQNAPWARVQTPVGVIEMGPRRRVYSLTWEDSEAGVWGEDLVDDPNVTHWATGVHCWGQQKLVDALRTWWKLAAKQNDIPLKGATGETR